ncbi:MAG: hypothetical protein JWM61_75 [Micrococcaceae bacterium]|nr:hypothetical protein [Micrococcaceae bacterium]
MGTNPSVQARGIPLFLNNFMSFTSIPSEVSKAKENRKDNQPKDPSNSELSPSHAIPTSTKRL